MSIKIKSRVVNTVIKVFLIVVFVYIIYNQIFVENDTDLMWTEFTKIVKRGNIFILFIVIILMIVNWSLESLKWQYFLSGFENISFFKSFKTILIGISMSIITPLKIGDYVGRVMMVENKNNWKAAWATFVAGFAQNMATVVFGYIGLVYYFDKIYIIDDYLFYFVNSLGLFFIIALFFLYYNIDLTLKIAKRIGLKKMVLKVSGNENVKNIIPVSLLTKILILSIIRYFVFTFQFYLILTFFGIEGPVLAICEVISIVFLIQSGIPLPPIANILARGEIAILMFSIFTDNKILILSSSFSLWVINLLIPAFIGMYFIIKLNITKSFGYD